MQISGEVHGESAGDLEQMVRQTERLTFGQSCFHWARTSDFYSIPKCSSTFGSGLVATRKTDRAKLQSTRRGLYATALCRSRLR